MFILEFVCDVCEDKTPMMYQVEDDEKDVDELECWVCGGTAKNITRNIKYLHHPKVTVVEFD